MTEQEERQVREIIIKNFSEVGSPEGDVKHFGYSVYGLELDLSSYYFYYQHHYVLFGDRSSKSLFSPLTILGVFGECDRKLSIIGISHDKEDALKQLRKYVYEEPVNMVVEQIFRNSLSTSLKELKIGEYSLKDLATLPPETRVAEKNITLLVRNGVIKKLKTRIENIE